MVDVGDAASRPLVTITNEFASVEIREVVTGNGTRLEICSPRLGTSVRLDALALESLTWQEPQVFSRFLETPLGE